MSKYVAIGGSGSGGGAAAAAIVIDARDYGATFDNVTNDTAAIQAALDAAPITLEGASGNDNPATIVQLPPGRAQINGTLTIPANTWLRGHGPSSSYLVQTSPTADTINNKPNTVQITVSDLGIIHNGTPTAGSGIDFSNTGGGSILGDSRNIIRDVQIVGTYHGVRNLGGSEGRMIRVQVQRCIGVGIEPLATDCFISDCTVGQAGSTAFLLTGANSRVWGCKVFGGGGGKAFDLNGAGRHQLAACEVQDYNGDGYYISVGNMTLSSCMADSVSGHGFNLESLSAASPVAINGGQVIKRDGAAFTPQSGVRLYNVAGAYVQVQTSGSFPQLLTAGTRSLGQSTYTINNSRGHQEVAYAATIQPNPFAGGNVYVGTLTGNITINSADVSPQPPAERFYPGQRASFTLTQDATGGRVVTFGSLFALAAAIPTTPSTVTRVEIEWDGAKWREVGRATTTA